MGGFRMQHEEGPTSSEQIMRTGSLLLQGFIQDRIQSMGWQTSQLALDWEPQDPAIKRMSEVLRRIGDELDNDVNMKRVITVAVETETTWQLFSKVAAGVFADGRLSWGRIVALFCFTTKLVFKALCSNLPEMIRTIMDWMMKFLKERLLNWIQQQGGWDGLLSYYQPPLWQTVTFLVAGALILSSAFWKKKLG
ncbi:apoptosis regulator BAX-like isoform X2 [Erinaceus europaeus]|uniref:Apoptosis regulator BAX-like isoform X2 n=1 Tax=Erinaceus europaeus TaxID=9365 RepID=A0ABM3WV17_ERIEU|nr:apoptosis regulator BAX-like isoform X2 [Erinaceus europaeus]